MIDIVPQNLYPTDMESIAGGITILEQPLFESDQRAISIDYLHKLQEDAYRSVGLEPPNWTFDEYRQRLHSVQEAFYQRGQAEFGIPVEESRHADSFTVVRMKELFESRETPLQHPGDWVVIEYLTRAIEDSSVPITPTLPARPVVGTLPSTSINAFAIAVPRTSVPVIVIHRGLFGCLHLLSKAIILVLADTSIPKVYRLRDSEEEVSDHFNQNPEVYERFSDAIMAYLVNGDVYGAEQYIPSFTQSALAWEMYDGAELFVLSHEYAHISNGDLGTPHFEDELEGLHKRTGYPRSWIQEFWADTKGMEIMLNARSKNRETLHLKFLGARMTFAIMDLINAGLACLADGKQELPDPSSHPPLSARSRALLKFVTANLAEDAAELARLNSHAMHFTLSLVWDRLKPELRSKHHAGVRPHPLWGRFAFRAGS